MDILLTICFISACFFVGWNCCLLFLTFKSKKINKEKIDLGDDIKIEKLVIPNGNVKNAILSAKKSMRL